VPEERAPARSRTLAGVLLGAGLALELSSLSGVVREELGREPAVRQVFLALLVATLAFAAMPGKLVDRLWSPTSRLRILPLALAPLLAALLPALAALAATTAGADAASSLVPRAIAAGLVGFLVGGAAGLAVNTTGSLRASLPALAAGAALAGLAPVSPLGVGVALVLTAAILPRGAPLAADPVPGAARRESLAATLALALGGAGLLGATPLLAHLLALRGASPRTLPVALAGVALGATLRSRRRRPASLAAGFPALVALGLLGGALAFAPSLLESGEHAILIPLGLAACAVGLSIERALGRAERAALLGLMIAPVLAAGVERAAQGLAPRAWSRPARAWLASPPGKTAPADFAAPLERGDLVSRSFAFSAEGVVAVIDSRAGNCRELRRDGALVGSVAVDKGESEAQVLTPVLASVLVEVLGSPGGHVATLGLADGIAAGTLGHVSGLADLFLVEPDAALLAIRDDPGDLFDGAWREPAARLVPEDARAFLRRSKTPLDGIVDLDGGLPRAGDLELAREHLAEGAVLVRVVRAARFHEAASVFVHVFPDALAFHAPRHPEVALLVGGRAPLDPRKLVLAGLPAGDPAAPPVMEDLAPALARTRLPASLLTGTFAAGAEGILAATTPRELAPTVGDLSRLAQALAATPGAAFVPGRLVRFADSSGKLGFEAISRAILDAARGLAKEETAELCRAEGDALFREGKDADAVLRWNHALELDPGATAPRLSLATRLLKRADYAGARKVLERAVVFDPERDVAVRYLLGKIALGEKAFPEAREHFQAAAGFEDADRQLELATELEHEQATLETLPGSPEIKAEDKDPKRLYQEGRLLLDETAEHEATYARYLSRKNLEPNPEQLATFRARREDARALLELASRKAPGDAAIFRELGRARLVLGDGAGARDAFETAGRLDPTDGRALFALGDVLRDQGEDEHALDAYKQGLSRGSISSTSARIFLACADIHVKKGRFEDAARTLEESERLAEGNPIVPVNLASIYVRLGRKPDAIRAYHRYLDLVGEGGDPDLKKRVAAALAKLERN
jgi:tetratricopeptide (TPR) repeat protein